MKRTPGPISQVVPLGLNGFYPSHGRQTMCFLVDLETPEGRVALLLDAGTGVGRLAESTGSSAPVPLHDYVRVEVVLTHYHLDHVSGLAALPAAFRAGGGRAPVRLWAPTLPLVDAEPVEALHRLIAPPLFPHRLDAFQPAIEVRPYRDAADLDELAGSFGTTIRVRRNLHPGGAVGLRFGDQLAYVTDSAPDPEKTTAENTNEAGTVGLTQGVDTLMHEVWASAAEAEADPRLLLGHSDTTSVRAMAERAGVRRLVPVHHPPQRDGKAIRTLHDELDGAAYALHRPRETEPILFPASDAAAATPSPS